MIETSEKAATMGETAEVTNTRARSRKFRMPSLRGQSGLVRLLSASGILMAFALPIGVYPRIMQSAELEHTHQQISEKLPVVSVAKPQVAPAERQIILPGSIEAVVETPVFARTNGYVTQRFVDIGDRVAAGQLLATIDTPEVDESQREAHAQVLTNIATRAQTEANRERAAADVDSARAEVAQAKANLVERESEQKFAYSSYIRWKALAEQGAVSQQDADEKETRFKTSKAAVDAAKDRIIAAESALRAAQARLKAEDANIGVSAANVAAASAREKRAVAEKSFQHVVAPFAGVVTERNVESGMLVSSGSDSSKLPMYKVSRIDQVKVFVDVPQYSAVGVRVGQTVKVSVKEYPGRVFTGKVARTAVALDPTARTMRTEVHIANSDMALSPGMYVDVNLSVPRTSQMFLVPANTLVMRDSSPRVVVVENNVAHYVPVKLGADLGKEIEIAHGLKGSEQLIVNPSDTLTEGTKVESAAL